jgi:tetratricopeptide (TPR) repeat protein
VDEAVRARIVEAAAGNPLYAEEVAGLLIDEGRLVVKDGRWTATGDLAKLPVPATISALLAARLDKLPSSQRRLLDVASVMGQVFYPAAVRLMANGGIDDVGPGLRSLVRQQFVRGERSDLADTEALAFRHLLIRDTAYDAIPKIERADLHERFAGWMEETGSSLGEQEEIVGYHLERAYRYRTELGNETARERRLADLAGSRLASAGTRASARGDLTAAVSLLTRAADLLHPDDPLRLSALTDLGRSLDWAGEPERARTILDEAIERSTAIGDAGLRSHALVLRRVLSRDRDDAEAERDAEEAINVFEASGDERGLSRAWRLVADLRPTFENDAAYEQALSHARRARDVGEQAEIYWGIGYNLARGPTPVGEAIRRCQEILQQTEGNRTLSAEMYHALGHLLPRQGRFDEALDFATQCREINRENGYLWAYWSRAEIVWDVKMLAGQTAEALDVLAEGYEQIERMGLPLKIMSAWLSQTLYALGRFDDAEQPARAAAEADDDWSRYTGLGALSKVLARQGRLEEAERMAREAVTYFEATLYSIDRTAVLLDRAEVLRLAERRDEAVSTLEHALELFEHREDIVSAARTRSLIEELGGTAAETLT